MLTIDGSIGEGGGQVLRTALGLSAVTGKPFTMFNIRANRSKPGLKTQHVGSVQAVAAVCGGKVTGAKTGSREIVFAPGDIQSGEYNFSLATAGSTSLVLQAVLPPLLVAKGPSIVTIEGGTHNPMAPPFEFLSKSFFPLLNQLGPRVDADIRRYGFYPRGGGQIVVRVEPAADWSRIELLDRGEIIGRRAEAIVVGLPRHIAERELAIAARTLDLPEDSLHVTTTVAGHGPGNVIFIEIRCQHVTDVFAGFGRRGVAAEVVSTEACGEALAHVESGVPVGPHLADQLMLPMALAGGGSYITSEPTLHSRTNAQVIEMFLDTRVAINPAGDGRWRVEVG
jgi:RNA 3'-terminal phosphate cyclase (ATP)